MSLYGIEEYVFNVAFFFGEILAYCELLNDFLIQVHWFKILSNFEKTF
jgi:hypothetical protein